MSAYSFNPTSGEQDFDTDSIMVSMFEGATDATVKKDISLTEVIDMMGASVPHPVVDIVRKLQPGKLRNEQKKRLPAFTISGTYEGKRSKGTFKQHSGVICIDIDGKENPALEDPDKFQDIKDDLINDQFSMAVFTTPSGTGLGVWVRIEPAKHLEAFYNLEEYYRREHGIRVDKACKDETRLRFLTWDPEVEINEDARTFRRYSLVDEVPEHVEVAEFAPGAESMPKERMLEVWEAMQFIEPDSHQNLVDVGMALHSECVGQEYYIMWCKWASTHEKHDPKIMPTKWSSFGDHPGSQINIETLFHMAYEGGEYDGPSAKVESVINLAQATVLPLDMSANIAEREQEPIYPILEGLVDKRDILAIVAPSKAGKTWLSMQLGLSLSTGRSFLGFNNVAGPMKILYVQLEVKRASFQYRHKMMYAAMNIDPQMDGMAVVHGRDLNVTMSDIRATAEQLGADGVVIDPVYMLADGDEKESEQWIKLIREFRAITAFALVAYIHHDKKGNAADLEETDRGSGSGVQGRAWDTQLSLTKHADDEEHDVPLRVITPTTRNYATPEPVTVELRNGCFQVLEDVEASTAKTTTGSTAKPKTDRFEILDMAVDYLSRRPYTKQDLERQLQQHFPSMSTNMWKNTVKKMINDHESIETYKHNPGKQGAKEFWAFNGDLTKLKNALMVADAEGAQINMDQYFPLD